MKLGNNKVLQTSSKEQCYLDFDISLSQKEIIKYLSKDLNLKENLKKMITADWF